MAAKYIWLGTCLVVRRINGLRPVGAGFMSEQFAEKTEQPTQRKLDDAIKRGSIPRSPEVQTVFVFLAAALALILFGRETWKHLTLTMSGIFGHLNEWQVSINLLPGQSINAALTVAQCVGPIVFAIMLGGLIAGCIQTRFQTASEALTPNWDRLDPAQGFQRLFSMQSAVATSLACLKLAVIIFVIYGEFRKLLSDPVFFQTVDVARIAGFLAESSLKVFLRITLVLVFLAAIDYGYQWWKHHKEMMMTKEEVKEEMKGSEANPHVRSAQKRRRRSLSFRKTLLEVPKADVVVTNPTHLAVALRYDSKTMKAPQVVAKGSRLHALKIKEIAGQHQVPVVENKPLARMIYKYGRVGGEVPAQFFVAVAEILAWVYRVNRYKYYTQGNQVS